MDNDQVTYSWDIQKNIYLKGEDLLRDNPKMDAPEYNFEFDRFYAAHEGETKKYNFVATLNEEVVEEEVRSGHKIAKATSEFKNVGFEWNGANKEVWHIDMPEDNYNRIKYKIYYLDELGNINPDCVVYKNKDGIIYDYYGKDRIYFIYDKGLNLFSQLDKSEILGIEDYSIINDTILGIRNLIPRIEAIGITKDEMKAAGFNPEDYGVV